MDIQNIFEKVSLRESDIRQFYGGGQATQHNSTPDGSCCDDFIDQCNMTTQCDGERTDDAVT